MPKIDFLTPVVCPKGRPLDWHRDAWSSMIRKCIDANPGGWAPTLMLIATHMSPAADPGWTPDATRVQAESLTQTSRICVVCFASLGTRHTHLPVVSILRGLTREAGVNAAAVMLGWRQVLGPENPSPDELTRQINDLTAVEISRIGYVGSRLWGAVGGNAVELRGWAQYAAWLDSKPLVP